MTDSHDSADEMRVDLRGLAPSDAQADRVMRAVMAEVVTRSRVAGPARRDPLEIVGRYVPDRWVAAALILSAASLAFVAMRVPPPITPMDDMVAAWAADEHVPTNAELLAAFQGYRR